MWVTTCINNKVLKKNTQNKTLNYFLVVIAVEPCPHLSSPSPCYQLPTIPLPLPTVVGLLSLHIFIVVVTCGVEERNINYDWTPWRTKIESAFARNLTVNKILAEPGET